MYCPPSPHNLELPEVPSHLTVSLLMTWCVILPGQIYTSLLRVLAVAGSLSHKIQSNDLDMYAW